MIRGVRGRLGADLAPSALAGGSFLLAWGRLTPVDGHRTVLLAVGALVGIGLALLVRLFRISRWGYPLAGLVVGPVPFALFADEITRIERGLEIWVGGAVLGALVGALEWAREARSEPRDR